MATPTTIDTDTELSAVNSILGAIGQSPVTSLGNVQSTTTTNAAGVTSTIHSYENPEIAFIYNILSEVNKDVQNEGWGFNIEYHVKISPTATTKYVHIPTNVLSYDINDGQAIRTQDVVRRNGRLYDKVHHTDEFESDVYLDVVYLWPYEDLPPAFKRYIVYRAAVRAATQLVANPALVQLLQQQELQAKSTCLEYECNQGDHSYFGLSHDQSYRSYKPYQALRR
tara:strand:+ start:1188 stop:1862 length:675 start_codon:yes stop_codon:yes gene_type:complete